MILCEHGGVRLYPLIGLTVGSAGVLKEDCSWHLFSSSPQPPVPFEALAGDAETRADATRVQHTAVEPAIHHTTRPPHHKQPPRVQLIELLELRIRGTKGEIYRIIRFISTRFKQKVSLMFYSSPAPGEEFFTMRRIFPFTKGVVHVVTVEKTRAYAGCDTCPTARAARRFVPRQLRRRTSGW